MTFPIIKLHEELLTVPTKHFKAQTAITGLNGQPMPQQAAPVNAALEVRVANAKGSRA